MQVYKLGKDHIHFIAYLISFHKCRLWNSSSCGLINGGPSLSFQIRSASAASPCRSPLCDQRCDFFILWPALYNSQIVFLISQHFTSSETQATNDGCFARQPVRVVVFSLTPVYQGEYISMKIWKWNILTYQSGFPIPRLIFCSKLIAYSVCEADGIRGLVVTSRSDPVKSMSYCLRLRLSSLTSRLYRRHCIRGWWSQHV